MSDENEHGSYRSDDGQTAGGSNNTPLILIAGLLALILLGSGAFFLFSRNKVGYYSQYSKSNYLEQTCASFM